MNAIIYSLKDPETLEVKYIGQTIASLTTRLSAHLSDRGNKAKGRWIKGLISQKTRPVIELIESVEIDQACEREMYWIKHFKDGGAELFNMAKPRNSPRQRNH